MSLDTDVTEVLLGEECEVCGQSFMDEEQVRHIKETMICMECCEAEHN